MESTQRRLTCIDLFSGCGGFSLGLQWAGLECLAAIDFNESAIETFRTNHPEVRHALVRDLTEYGPEELEGLLGTRQVDLVVGGPPCQGFSKARQADGANHGIRLVEDPRRELYREYLRFVAHFRPLAFIMENVPGIRSAAGGEFFTRVQVESRKLDYRVVPFEVQAWRFGVPQKRVRQFIIGTRRDLPLFVVDRYIRATHAAPDAAGPEAECLEPAVTLGEAIGDLPAIRAGDESHQRAYDEELRERHVARYGVRFVHDVEKANMASTLTSHAARPHSLRDLRDFARLREGETSREAIARGVEMEFPYDRESFKDRYTRQHRDRLCSTIVAHLKKDGLMFIHPTQLRSLTPREAARIQTFPDTFVLPQERTKAFAQVGNAVPPLVGRALGHAVRQYLTDAWDTGLAAEGPCVALPSSREAAIGFLEEFVESLFTRPITRLDKEEFLRVWGAVGYLHPQLHPDAVLDNGHAVSRGTRRDVSFVLEPVYVRSGWPVELMPIAQEARRRFEVGLLHEREYYCSAAIMAGEVMNELTARETMAGRECGEQGWM
jgi:DNA (cytosine-5)-methyltransferase 1